MYFSLYKMHIDGIIMNRILPQGIKDDYFESWKKSQKRYAEMAKMYFSPVPVLPVCLFEDEIVGSHRLRILADRLYGKQNPLKHFFEGSPYLLSKENGGYKLVLKLPFIARENIELNKASDELIVRIGSFKRHILLPRQVASVEAVRARLDGQDLHIDFKLKGD